MIMWKISSTLWKQTFISLFRMRKWSIYKLFSFHVHDLKTPGWSNCLLSSKQAAIFFIQIYFIYLFLCSFINQNFIFIYVLLVQIILMKDIVLLSGTSHPSLSLSIAQKLSIPLSQVKLGHFSNNETSVEIIESIRDMDVYIIQSFHGHINHLFMELCILIHACKIASARKSKMTTMMLFIMSYFSHGSFAIISLFKTA